MKNTCEKLLTADEEDQLVKAAYEISCGSVENGRMVSRVLTKFYNHARTLNDLWAVPGNHLEKLVGDRRGQLAIRINRQWRVCFDWQGGDAWNVEVTDYH